MKKGKEKKKQEKCMGKGSLNQEKPIKQTICEDLGTKLASYIHKHPDKDAVAAAAAFDKLFWLLPMFVSLLMDLFSVAMALLLIGLWLLEMVLIVSWFWPLLWMENFCFCLPIFLFPYKFNESTFCMNK